ncbi:2-dehydro-3-deoxy-6-phosphogalactonate aldolase [Martelella alba]|uniref:2-dehydro-3-deoxy-6-phosphogalactonate aldolase n=1 Tax=Martelella alba TaxID=2590451 RepID=A0ABY2SDP8_9HYPH|nr:2-dehydro-3-deoxy-6-phosphogalactonate aldolase [Martelella alba]TKI02631.1 2-dehydro-3-deoxy-6-phosphogalactonate aldolase [Martelella alba]
MSLQTWLKRMPLIAILRGVTPDDILPVGRVLKESGFAIIEIPMNSPEPIESIRRLAAEFGEDLLVGAGTVLNPADVDRIAAAGGRIIVMPHADTRVIRRAHETGLYCTPGIASPTEGFAALEAGADGLKLFPAEGMSPAVLKALRAVFPANVPLLPVGGVTPQTMSPWLAAGAAGFGLGSALYKPGLSAQAVGENARAFVAALQAGKMA